jgi:hypothetical protein
MSEPIDVMDLGRAGTGFALKWLEEAKEEITRLKAERDEGLRLISDYELRLSAEMPIDFKDWYRNSRKDWPEVAASVIRNAREEEERLEQTITTLLAERDGLKAENARYRRDLDILGNYIFHDEVGAVCQQVAANALKGGT